MKRVYKTSQCHTGNLMSNLKANGDYCDVTIKSGNYQVRAHKCVLAASTGYFRRRLANDTHEAETGIVDFSTMLPDVVKELVDFIYLGSAELSMATVKGLIDAAKMLQLPGLSDLCVEFLAENIDLNNFGEVLILAEVYNMALLNTSIRKFLYANLEQVLLSDDFKLFTHEDVKYCYRLMQGASSETEEIKWHALMNWTHDDLEEREMLFHDLFHWIDLRRLSRDFIKEHISSENIIDGCMSSLHYAWRFCTGMEPSIKKRITSPNHITSINRYTRLVYQYDLIDKEWAVVGGLPTAIGWHQSIAEYNGILYVGDSVSLHSYSETGWKLLHLHRPASGRQFFTRYNRIVCAGGWVIMVTGSVAVMVGILSGRAYEVHRHSSAQFTDGFFISGSDATVYVIGGVERPGDSGDSKTVAKLQLAERRFGRVDPMVIGRAYGAAIQHKGVLYAMGGRSRTVEFLNTWTRQWQILTGCEIQCHNVTVHLADKIYIFGGALGTEVKSVELDQLEITAKELRPTRRSAGDMDVCCSSYSKYTKLSRC